MGGIAGRREAPPRDQNEVVIKHAPLVRRIAINLVKRLPPTVQIDDLIQAGTIGLLEASRNHDERQGASFETYAGIRIRGAMLDEIRKNDWTPRSLHRKVRQVAEAVRTVECSKGRDARDVEVAECMGIGLEAFHRILQDASGHKVLSFDDLTAENDTMTKGMSECLGEPLDQVMLEEFRQALARIIASLPDRERLVLSLYHDKGCNLRQIGSVLHLTESRACQIHNQAMLRLKSRLNDWRKSGWQDKEWAHPRATPKKASGRQARTPATP